MDFGSFKGTIKRYHGEQVRVYDGNDEINFASVVISFLDTPTLELVQSRF